jgi:hypothetical protein
MGNYFLKTASDYVVPSDQRLTVVRALDRIMKIRSAVISEKSGMEMCYEGSIYDDLRGTI